MKKSQQSRESWLEQALEVLRVEGIQGVRVERLARDLKVSKGSFYWHFQDKDELYSCMMEYWISRYNEIVFNSPVDRDQAADESLLNVIQMIRSENLDRYELAMRNWAAHDPQVAKQLKLVYARREKFLARFFRKLGFRGQQVSIRVRMLLCLLCWEPNMMSDKSSIQSEKNLKLYCDILTRS